MARGMSLRIELFPADLGRFVDFYTRVLRFEVEGEQLAAYVAVRRDSVRIGAVKAWTSVDPGGRAVPQGAELVLEVDDVAAERDAVVATGWPLEADLTHQPWGLRDFRVFDPDGHYVRITSRDSSPA